MPVAISPPSNAYLAAKDVTAALVTSGLTLAEYLDVVLWGDEHGRADDQMRGARRQLTSSPLLPDILKRMYSPPASKSGGSRPVGAREIMRDFALSTVAGLVEGEIEAFAQHLRPSPTPSAASICSIDIDKITEEMKQKAPSMTKLLMCLAQSKAQKERNTFTNPYVVCPDHIDVYMEHILT